MKKLLLLSALLNCVLLFSQFTLTTDNFKNATDPEKNYIIIEAKEKNKLDLFKSVKSYINSTFKGVKQGSYNEIEPDQIVIDVESTTGYVKILGIEQSLGEANIRYEFNFKDGKIMIKPFFQKLTLPDNNVLNLTGGNMLIKAVFNNNGKVSIKKQTFEGLQNLPNKMVENITKSIINQNSDW
ncbi:hypothetical protein [Soonwooa purpurea]